MEFTMDRMFPKTIDELTTIRTEGEGKKFVTYGYYKNTRLLLDYERDRILFKFYEIREKAETTGTQSNLSFLFWLKIPSTSSLSYRLYK